VALLFEREEFDRRISAALADRDLATILLFAQESHYYLTGYDTTGYVFFQCIVLTADDQPITLLTRRRTWSRPGAPPSWRIFASGTTARAPRPAMT
jgi:Xaa-Pro aminopeptidase